MIDKLNILFASQTGTAEELAYEIHNKCSSMGIKSNLSELDDISINDLKKINKLMIVTSTTGDGEIPDNGKIFWEQLSKEVKLNLSSLNYGVLALGDSSHYDFCNAGKIIDIKLKDLGANRIIERLECDFDTDGSENWYLNFFKIINKIN